MLIYHCQLTKMRLRGDWWRRILRVAIDVDEEWEKSSSQWSFGGNKNNKLQGDVSTELLWEKKIV